MKQTKTYHKQNCQTIVRATYVLSSKISVILSGRHAFEYTITIKKPQSISSMTFKNRNAALSEISVLKEQHRKFGDVCLRIC